MPLTKNNTKAAAETAKKVEAAAVAEAPVYDAGVLGSKSDTIAFVAPLGDPSRIDNTYAPNEKGESTIAGKTPYIVGYRLKALVDMVVPECGMGADARKNLMTYVDATGTKQVKAGEEFDLTRFETGLLLAPDEYNGRITGEGKAFSVVYQQKKNPGAEAGKIADVSAASAIPTVSIRPESGSIKDYQILEVLSFTSEKVPVGNNGHTQIRKTRTINPGFEKFEALCQAAPPRVRKSSSAPKARRNAGAQAFLDIVNKRK